MLVAEMLGGSLPGQICVIVAVTNMIITGRWEREREEEEGDSGEEEKKRACVKFAACR